MNRRCLAAGAGAAAGLVLLAALLVQVHGLRNQVAALQAALENVSGQVEAVAPLWTGDMLQVSAWSVLRIGAYRADMADGDARLYLALYPQQGGVVAGAEDVAALTLTVSDAGGNQLGTVTMAPSDPPPEESPNPAAPVESLPQPVGADPIWYAADIGPYVQGDSFDVRFSAVLTTAGGLTLSDENPVATSSRAGPGVTGSSGEVDFRPQFS